MLDIALLRVREAEKQFHSSLDLLGRRNSNALARLMVIHIHFA